MNTVDMPAHAALLSMLERLSGRTMSSCWTASHHEFNVRNPSEERPAQFVGVVLPSHVSRLLAYSSIQAQYYILQFLTMRGPDGPPSFNWKDRERLEYQRYSIERTLIAQAVDIADSPFSVETSTTHERQSGDGRSLAITAIGQHISEAMIAALDRVADSKLPKCVRLAIESTRDSERGGMPPAERMLADIALLQLRKDRDSSEWFDVEVWRRLGPVLFGFDPAMEKDFRAKLDTFRPDDAYDTFFDTRVRIQGRFLRYDRSAAEGDALASISPSLARAIADTCKWKVLPIAVARIVDAAHSSTLPTNVAEERDFCRRIVGDLTLFLDALSCNSNWFGMDWSDDYDTGFVLEGLWEAGLHVDIGEFDNARHEIEKGRLANRAKWLREAGSPEQTLLTSLDHPFAAFDAATYEELLAYLAKLTSHLEDARRHYTNAREILTAIMESPAGNEFTCDCEDRLDGIGRALSELVQD